MPGDGMEVIMVAALALDLVLLAHQDTALDPMVRQAQDSVLALQASRFLLVVTLKKLNGL